MLRLVSITTLSFTLLFAAAGCGNVEMRKTANDEGKPAPGDDDDDDGGGPGPGATPTPTTPGDGGTWDPGTAPTSIGGMAAFARIRNRAVGDVAGAFDDFTGMVQFFPLPAGPVPPTLQEVWDDYPSMAMDSCKQIYPSSLSIATNIDLPNAGTITLEGPSGSISLDPMFGQGMYVSFWNDPTAFVPVSDYVLRAEGAQIGAFQVPMKSPGQITALTPDVTSAAPYVIPRDTPLNLKWESVPDGRPIYLTLTQRDYPEMQPYMWMCKLTDDGEFDVPVNVLQNFGATIEPFPTEEWRDKIDLRRYHYSAFTVPGGVAPILSGFESGWYADVSFE